MKCPDCQNGWYLGAGLKPPERCTTCKGTNEVNLYPGGAFHRKVNLGYPTGLKAPEKTRYEKGTNQIFEAADPEPWPEHAQRALDDAVLMLLVAKRHAPVSAALRDMINLGLSLQTSTGPKGGYIRSSVPEDAVPIRFSGSAVPAGSVLTLQICPGDNSLYFRPKGMRLFVRPGDITIESITVRGWPQIPAPVDGSRWACLEGTVPVKFAIFSQVVFGRHMEITFTAHKEIESGDLGYIVGTPLHCAPAFMSPGQPQP